MRPGSRLLTLLAIGALLLVAGGVRVVMLKETQPLRLVGDERYYATVAANISLGRGHRAGKRQRAFRPPAAAFVLALVADAEQPLTPLRAEAMVYRFARLQVFLGTLVVAATVGLGWALFGRSVGLLAGWMAALYPTLVAFSRDLWSETLCALLVTTALIGVALVERGRRTWVAALTGLAFGAAALTREIAIGLAGLCALWWVWTAPRKERRLAVVQGSLMLLVAAAVVLPWTIRNYRVLGHFVPVSTVGWYAAGAGNMLDDPDWMHPPDEARAEYKRRYWKVGGDVESMLFAREETLAAIRAEQPTWILKKLLRNLPLLFGPDSSVLYKLAVGGYGEPPPVWTRTVVVLALGAYLFVAIGAVLGVAAAGGRGRRSLGCLVVAAVAFVHVLTIANTRHRVPILPLLIVYASHAVLHWRAIPGALSGRRWIAPAAVLGFFLVVCVPYAARYSHAARLWTATASAESPSPPAAPDAKQELRDRDGPERGTPPG